MVGYGREPDFVTKAPGERPMPERIVYALEHVPAFVRAVNRERGELREHRRRRLWRPDRVSRL
jgi:hypothetical protein